MKRKKLGFRQQFVVSILAALGTLLLEICVFILIITNPNYTQHFNTNTSQGVLGAIFGFMTILLIAFAIRRFSFYRAGISSYFSERLHEIDMQYELIINQLYQEIEELRLKIADIRRTGYDGYMGEVDYGQGIERNRKFSFDLESQHLARINELEQELYINRRKKIDEINMLFNEYSIG